MYAWATWKLYIKQYNVINSIYLYKQKHYNQHRSEECVCSTDAVQTSILLSVASTVLSHGSNTPNTR